MDHPVDVVARAAGVHNAISSASDHLQRIQASFSAYGGSSVGLREAVRQPTLRRKITW
jgi:hypothetical protein